MIRLLAQRWPSQAEARQTLGRDQVNPANGHDEQKLNADAQQTYPHHHVSSRSLSDGPEPVSHLDVLSAHISRIPAHMTNLAGKHPISRTMPYRQEMDTGHNGQAELTSVVVQGDRDPGLPSVTSDSLEVSGRSPLGTSKLPSARGLAAASARGYTRPAEEDSMYSIPAERPSRSLPPTSKDEEDQTLSRHTDLSSHTPGTSEENNKYSYQAGVMSLPSLLRDVAYRQNSVVTRRRLDNQSQNPMTRDTHPDDQSQTSMTPGVGKLDQAPLIPVFHLDNQSQTGGSDVEPSHRRVQRQGRSPQAAPLSHMTSGIPNTKGESSLSHDVVEATVGESGKADKETLLKTGAFGEEAAWETSKETAWENYSPQKDTAWKNENADTETAWNASSKKNSYVKETAWSTGDVDNVTPWTTDAADMETEWATNAANKQAEKDWVAGEKSLQQTEERSPEDTESRSPQQSKDAISRETEDGDIRQTEAESPIAVETRSWRCPIPDVVVGDESLPWACRQRWTWRFLGEHVYPSRLYEAVCEGRTCWYGHYNCTPITHTLQVLQFCLRGCNDQRVPYLLRSHWQWTDVNVTVGCQCVR